MAQRCNLLLRINELLNLKVSEGHLERSESFTIARKKVSNFEQMSVPNDNEVCFSKKSAGGSAVRLIYKNHIQRENSFLNNPWV